VLAGVALWGPEGKVPKPHFLIATGYSASLIKRRKREKEGGPPLPRKDRYSRMLYLKR